MKYLKIVMIAAGLATGCSAGKNSMSGAPKGFQSLFDGRTTTGWHTYGKQTVGAKWKVEDGALFLDASNKTKGEGGDIVTNEDYENYHLKLDWKISPGGNSGIIFNVNEDLSKYNATYSTGPEMQVIDNDGHADAKFQKHRAGDLYDLISSSKENAKPVGEWNTSEIILNQGKLELRQNGETIVKTNMWDENWKQMVDGSKFKGWPGFGIYKSGKIALQDHGDNVWYRNIYIKKL